MSNKLRRFVEGYSERRGKRRRRRKGEKIKKQINYDEAVSHLKRCEYNNR
jgi:hypothetical protein